MHKNMKVIISSERRKMLMIPLALACVLSACGGGSSSVVSATSAPATAPSLSVAPQNNFTSTSGGVDVNAVNRSITNFNAGK